MSAFNVEAFTSGATLQELSDQFVNMQIGKATWYELAGADMLMGTDDDVSMTETEMGAFQAGVPTMGFRDLNFAAAVVAGACADGVDSLGAGTCAANGSTLKADFDIVATDPASTGINILNGWSSGYASNLSTFGDGEANSAFEYMTDTGFELLIPL